MGFLDQSTNNIILDAVLTDLGREFLSRNDGSFSIIKFALGDDEVDYNIIQQYGRTVGKEKIEKNTPILEAQTGGSLAVKYKLISTSNNSLIRLPSIALVGDINSTTNLVSLTRSASSGATSTASLTVKQSLSGGNLIGQELMDDLYKVEVNNIFLALDGQPPDSVTVDNIATYTMTKDPGTLPNDGSQLNMSLSLKSFSDSVFNTYKAKGTSYIKTYVKVSGVKSGASKVFEVNITS